jgi:ABC-type transport system substrate-binding protein
VSLRSLRFVATALFVGVTLTACGSSNAPTPNPNATPASAASAVTAPLPTHGNATAATCPSAATVGSALGITVSNPAGGTATSLQGGGTSITCDYSGAAMNVIIEVLTNIDPSRIDQFSSRYPVAYKSVSGVGDQARSFSQKLGGGKDNEGVVATKGSTLVSITATGTPASLSQVEALVGQLL